MIDPGFLYTVAQVGITYAGFSTLVTVVAYRQDMAALPARIYYMLLLSIIVIAFAFIPAVLQAYEIDEVKMWRISSALFGLVWGVYWINAINKLRTRFRVWGDLSFLNKLHTALLHPASVVGLVFGALGYWGNRVGAVYVTALFVMLYMSAYLFLQIITDLLDQGTDSPDKTI